MADGGVMDAVKPCVKCGALDRNQDGRCKACTRERQRAWNNANREKVREQQRAWSNANREKERERTRAYRAANREKVRERERAVYYGLTVDEVTAMGSKCALCGENGTSIDHDGRLEKRLISEGMPKKKARRESVRGLLCQPCNLSLGFYEASSARGWEKVERYLARPRPFSARPAPKKQEDKSKHTRQLTLVVDA